MTVIETIIAWTLLSIVAFIAIYPHIVTMKFESLLRTSLLMRIMNHRVGGKKCTVFDYPSMTPMQKHEILVDFEATIDYELKSDRWPMLLSRRKYQYQPRLVMERLIKTVIREDLP